MKTEMIVKSINNGEKAKIEINTNYEGIDKIKEFSEIKNKFSDATKIGMEWNNTTGEYETTIVVTPENAKPFVEYAESHNIKLVTL